MSNGMESPPRWVGPLGIVLCLASLITASVLASTGQWVRAVVSVVISLVLGVWGIREYQKTRRS